MRVKLMTFRDSSTLRGFDDTALTEFVRDKAVIAFHPSAPGPRPPAAMDSPPAATARRSARHTEAEEAQQGAHERGAAGRMRASVAMGLAGDGAVCGFALAAASRRARAPLALAGADPRHTLTCSRIAVGSHGFGADRHGQGTELGDGA